MHVSSILSDEGEGILYDRVRNALGFNLNALNNMTLLSHNKRNTLNRLFFE